jgi:hypothetical protein
MKTFSGEHYTTVDLLYNFYLFYSISLFPVEPQITAVWHPSVFNIS